MNFKEVGEQERNFKFMMDNKKQKLPSNQTSRVDLLENTRPFA